MLCQLQQEELTAGWQPAVPVVLSHLPEVTVTVKLGLEPICLQSLCSFH